MAVPYFLIRWELAGVLSLVEVPCLEINDFTVGF
jgi:hypothetical protein